MRDCQVEAITSLEQSFAAARPRALIQMATGAGKTYTACAFTYRLIKHAGAKRVLFLVDRANLGRQAMAEFQQFVTPDTGRKFTELYNVQHLTSNQLDSVARVTICTIQRLYSMLRGEELDEDLAYAAQELDRSVVVPSQIRTVLQAFKGALFTELFPGRTLVPKTLIFCKDDSHAEDVVHLVREVFGKGNDFAKKITYKTYNPETKRYEKSETLIQEFRISPQLRIAVTVDMIATGTDIKPLECLLFLRDVRSRVYFEQMKGRGTRVLTPTDLQAVSGADAHAKNHFLVVDAVGVCESDKTDSRPLERQRTVTFVKLMLGVALGKRDEDTLTTLAGRIARLDREVTAPQRKELTAIAGGRTLAELSATLLRAIDPDAIAEQATGVQGASPTDIAPDAFEAARQQLVAAACAPFDTPALRDALAKAKQEAEQTIDTVTIDIVTQQGYDAAAKEKAANLLKSFRDYIEQHRAQITALQILYSRPYRQRLTETMLKELEKKLRDTNATWNEENLWNACATAAPGKVKGRSAVNRFADLVPLVRFALEHQPVLEPFADSVNARFASWLAQQNTLPSPSGEGLGMRDRGAGGEGMNAGKPRFTPEQLAWLELIRDHVATSLSIEPEDFDYAPFSQRGGLGRAGQLFGEKLPELLDELNEALAA